MSIQDLLVKLGVEIFEDRPELYKEEKLYNSLREGPCCCGLMFAGESFGPKIWIVTRKTTHAICVVHELAHLALAAGDSKALNDSEDNGVLQLEMLLCMLELKLNPEEVLAWWVNHDYNVYETKIVNSHDVNRYVDPESFKDLRTFRWWKSGLKNLVRLNILKDKKLDIAEIRRRVCLVPS